MMHGQQNVLKKNQISERSEQKLSTSGAKAKSWCTRHMTFNEENNIRLDFLHLINTTVT